jgi:ribosomal protein S18 acetylase RimI-like enzyme
MRLRWRESCVLANCCDNTPTLVIKAIPATITNLNMLREMQMAIDRLTPPVREAAAEEVARMLAGLRVSDIHFGLISEPDAAVAFKAEPFDSELLGTRIGRIVGLRSGTVSGYDALLSALTGRARETGYAQVLRRTGLDQLTEIWALGRHGFELMDVGLVFGQILKGRLEEPPQRDLTVRHARDSDVETIIERMLQEPWGSRYEADPSYDVERVRALRTRWLRNSHEGRAAAFFVGVIDAEPAGYVTCLLDESERRGEIDLVGTLPAFRGRKVALRIVEHALAWFSGHAGFVTVRTQATNYAAAALYEKSGFTLHAADATYRVQL